MRLGLGASLYIRMSSVRRRKPWVSIVCSAHNKTNTIATAFNRYRGRCTKLLLSRRPGHLLRRDMSLGKCRRRRKSPRRCPKEGLFFAGKLSSNKLFRLKFQFFFLLFFESCDRPWLRVHFCLPLALRLRRRGPGGGKHTAHHTASADFP